MTRFASFLLIVFLTASGPGPLWAHGGGHEKSVAKPEATLPELPEETPGFGKIESGGLEYGLEPSLDSFETEIVDDDPLWGKNQEVLDNGEAPLDLNNMAGHDMPQMGEVKLAEHTWVATSQKGYGWALALTLFSGALFGFLTLRRPCE